MSGTPRKEVWENFAEWVDENLPECAEPGCGTRVYEQGERCWIHR